jgi:hypothetical protein
MCSAHYAFMCCVDLRTNSHYFAISHQVIGFYNRGIECLLSSKNWVFTSDRHSSVLTRLTLFDNPSFPFLFISSLRLEEGVNIAIFGHWNRDFIAHISSAATIQYGIIWVVQNVLARFRQVGNTTSWHAGHWSNQRLTITEDCPHIHWWGC